MRIGVDSGGTFTDFAWDGGILKLLSTPLDPAQAVLRGIRQILADNPHLDPSRIELIHGTTVATNALLTRSGGRVALVATAGFEDVIEIGRQDRPELYDLHPSLPPPLVPPELRFGLNERMAVDGTILHAPDDVELSRLAAEIAAVKPDAVAVCLLHAYAYPRHEQQIGKVLREHINAPVFLSSELDPQPREYERASTTVIHAYLAGKVQAYLRALSERLPGQLRILTSNGGTANVDQACARPADLVLSGPAGGVVCAAEFARLAGVPNFIGLDMGGTSTDVCLGWGERVAEDSGRDIEGLSLRVPRLAVHTVGAGGGSIARAGLGNVLLVGPESAGADPGPAAYGSGELPTVTDADLVLGRIPESHFGELQIQAGRSLAAIGRLADELGMTALACAEGIVRIADQRMAMAAAEVSQARGFDPRRCVLIPFGGAGPLHACAIAEQLGIRRVLVPPGAGVLSAIGAAASLPRRDVSASVMHRLESWDEVQRDAMVSVLRHQLAAELSRPICYRQVLHCRYAGQSYELPVTLRPGDDSLRLTTRFHREHRRVYGYAMPDEPVEVVTVLVSAIGGRPSPLPLPSADWLGLPARSGRGVASWSERTCSIFVAQGWEWNLKDLGDLRFLELHIPN